MGDNSKVSVVPTQADREAARKLYGSADWSQVRIATHFARHRLAHQTPPATQPSATVKEVKLTDHDKAYAAAPSLLMADAREMIDHLDAGKDWAVGVTDANRVSVGATSRVMRGLYALATLHTPPPVATATEAVDLITGKPVEYWAQDYIDRARSKKGGDQ